MITAGHHIVYNPTIMDGDPRCPRQSVHNATKTAVQLGAFPWAAVTLCGPNGKYVATVSEALGHRRPSVAGSNRQIPAGDAPVRAPTWRPRGVLEIGAALGGLRGNCLGRVANIVQGGVRAVEQLCGCFPHDTCAIIRRISDNLASTYQAHGDLRTMVSGLRNSTKGKVGDVQGEGRRQSLGKEPSAQKSRKRQARSTSAKMRCSTAANPRKSELSSNNF
jgi:hypothetical protein